MLSLSNGKVIRDFPIKDNPYTNICDYQETCEYTCLNKDVPQNKCRQLDLQLQTS